MGNRLEPQAARPRLGLVTSTVSSAAVDGDARTNHARHPAAAADKRADAVALREAAHIDLARAEELYALATRLMHTAAGDRAAAATARHQAAIDRAASSNDDLTGVLRRGSGLVA